MLTQFTRNKAYLLNPNSYAQKQKVKTLTDFDFLLLSFDLTISTAKD